MDENSTSTSSPAEVWPAADSDSGSSDSSSSPEHSDSQNSERNSEKNPSLLDRISFFLLLALVFFLPFSFQTSLSLTFVKISLASFFTAVIFILLCISALKRGSLVVPKGRFFLAALAVPCVFFLSGLFSGSISNSFFGNSFEIGTTISIILGMALLFATPRILRTKGQIFGIYIAFFASLFIVALYQLIHYIGGPGALSFGIFTSASSNLIGKWNEVGIFFGLGTILSLITLEILKLPRSFRIVVIIALAVSLFFVGLVDFLYVDIFIALVALCSCFYFYRSAKSRKKIAKPSVTVAVVALLFIIMYFFGAGLRNHLSANLNPYQVEVSPSFVQTMVVAGHTLKSSPIAKNFLLGSGPNFFQNEWFLYKPSSVSLSLFWNVDFSYGLGLVSTYLTTTGILGILAWIAFFVLFLWLGYKAVFKNFCQEMSSRSAPAESDMPPDTESIVLHYLPLSSFIAALYLWVFNIIYVPTGVIFILTFVFTGIFIASLYEEGRLANIEIPYVKRKFNLAVVFVLVVAILAAVSVFFVTGKKIVAAIYANDAVTVLNQQNNVASGEAYMKKAVALDAQPAYYRTIAQIDLLQINTILSSQQGTSTAKIASEFEPLWNDAIGSIESAEKADPKDYQNQLMLGNMYASVLTLGYPDAYNQASTAYQAALALDPTNPAIYLAMAQLEAANNNISGAATDITKALQEKQNYTDAIYFLAQLQVSQQDITGAIQSMTALAQLSPSDPTVFYQLGYLEYVAGDYSAAAQVLGDAVSIESDYSNARYFLGLSDYKLGKTSDAIVQFTDILQLNPGNQDVETIIANLRAGKAPLPDETSSTDQKAASQQLKNQPSQAGGANATSTVSNSGSQNSTTAKSGSVF